MTGIFGDTPDGDKVLVPTAYEREEYHDFLDEFIESSLFDDLNKETQQAVLVCRDTLCWTLGHENGAFENNLKAWSDYFKDHYDIGDSFNN